MKMAKHCIQLIILLLLQQIIYSQLPNPDVISSSKGNITIQPVFHGAMVFTMGDKVVYVDPYNGIHAYKGLPNPDYILITHVHQDHLDTSTLNALNTTKAKLVVPQAVADRLSSKWSSRLIVLSNDKTFTESNISITAVPMYDLPQTSNSRHVKGIGNGYVITFGDKRIYVSGDTDDIEEMRNLKNIDVAFVCMNQPFTMTIQQAAAAVLAFKPKIIYPYHYRDMNGFSDVEAFKKIIEETNREIEVRIRNWYEDISMAGKVTKLEQIVYGFFAGASLTMNIYKPERSNRIGILIIPGTAYGYTYTLEYSQASIIDNFIRDTGYFAKFARMLVDRGYTLFVINHRLAPQFHYKDILQDCQRAVRFIRYHANKYSIDPDHIGAFGYSSGATLCSMLGVTDLTDTAQKTGVDAMSSKVQAVVTLAARFDLSDFNKTGDTAIQSPTISSVLLNYMGELPAVENGNYVLSGKYAEASPITYVDKEDASFLIYAGSNDPLVPVRQQVAMYEKLIGKGVNAQLKISQHEAHNPIPKIEEMDAWFLKFLKKSNTY